MGASIQPFYDDGQVVVYHADCREILTTLLPVDLVATDPPYAFGQSRPEWRVTANIAISLSLAATKVRKGGAMAVLSAASGRGIEFVQGAIEPTLSFNRLLVWHKGFTHSRVAGPWRWDLVPVLLFGRACFGRTVGLSSCYESSGHPVDDTDHPSPLPAGLGDWLVAPFAEAKTVLDPFCGTGVFLAAAKRAGKKAIGIEIEERWCHATVQRLAQTEMLTEASA